MSKWLFPPIAVQVKLNFHLSNKLKQQTKRIFSLLSMKCREKHRYPLHLCLNEYKQKIKDHKQDLSQTTFGFWTF